ncbi:hypothetical protein EZJ49_12535 [Bdellovibrio bacteriovorus]|uniref:hypothetical protein n=1 Tax=Bdellovibrio bacteriovorus TaxID=959 RepID=UPI0021D005C9|nr:hypothetical protein [Bdellovibrio bacteriovorus]UXR63891.1 hypothetical protein EZJ49_12535 [Bdellovibrio bacteriovorus]
MKIDPADGLLKVFLKRTGTTSGDGGSVYDATAKTPLKINLDYQNRLLVWDYDRIRRIDLSENPPKIQTIIGGGNDSASQTYASPLNLKFTDIGSSFNFGNATFSPLPNGDFIFKSEKYPENGSNSTRLRIFHDSTNSISSVTFQGPAVPGHPEIDVKNCTLLSAAPVVDSSGTLSKYLVSFFTSPPSSDADCTYNNGWNYFQAYFDLNGDFVSNVNALGHGAIILGKDFKNYFVRREAGVVYQLDPNTNSWSAIAGKGKGICEDSLDVLNAECRLIVEDAFINANGKMYLFDNNTIRALRDDNTLLTLAGQNLSFGDNLDAINARFTNITSVDTWNDGGVLKTTALDIGAARIREFPVAGGAITTIAGNGNALQPNTGLDAHTTSMSPRSSQFILNKSNGNLYYIFNDKDIGLLNRSTNRWSRVVGGGTADYYNSDNTVGTSIEFNTTVTPLAFENNKLMLVSNWSNVAIGGTHRSMLKIYDSTDSYRQSHFMGTDSNTNPAYCATGTAVASCTFSAADSSLRTFYDSLDGFWLHARRGTKNIYQLPPGGNVASFTNVTQNMRAMTYYRRPNNSQVIFYCGSDGKLYKKELSSGVESEISLAGVPGMTCDGFGLSYVPSRDSLVFIYKKNDLSGVAEILAP